MKAALGVFAGACISIVIVYAVVNPDSGVIYHSPLGIIGIALIGLGLCKHAADRRHATT